MVALRYLRSMSHTAADFRDAAGRHLTDARKHLDDGNFAQASHLAGFAPECARKVLLADHWHKILGHRMSGPVVEALESLDPRQVCVGELEALENWDPGVRYHASTRFSEGPTRQLVDEAHQLTCAALARAWLVGTR